MATFRELIDWINDQIEFEEDLGNRYGDYRQYDNGLMSTAHYQRAAVFRTILSKLSEIDDSTQQANPHRP